MKPSLHRLAEGGKACVVLPQETAPNKVILRKLGTPMAATRAGLRLLPVATGCQQPVYMRQVDPSAQLA